MNKMAVSILYLRSQWLLNGPPRHLLSWGPRGPKGAHGGAGRARNPKGPQITPFCHQMGRHPTIWDFKTGIRHRIPARISPWGTRGLNPNYFSAYFGPKNAKKSIFWQGFEFIRDP